MKKLFTYTVLLSGLTSIVLSCAKQDDELPVPVGNELKIQAELVSSSAWTTRAADACVKYGESAEIEGGEYIITAQKEDWNAHRPEADTIATSDAPLTRGKPIASVESIAQMSVKIFQTGTSNWTSFSALTSAITATRSGNSYTTSPTYNWPVDPADKTSLFVYSPVMSSTNGLSENGACKINYTVPTVVGNQPDLCVAVPKMNVINNDGTQHAQSFTLQHRLTAVGFSMLGWNLKITKITLSGVSMSGTFDMSTSTWGSLGSVNSRDVGVTQSSYQHDWNSSYTNITTSDGYLMMIPQALLDAATVTITYASTGTGSTGGTITAKLKDLGVTWGAGDKITYNIRLKTAPAIISGDLMITTFEKGFSTSSPMSMVMDTKDNLTFTWNAPWLKIHRGPAKKSDVTGGFASGWKTGAGGPWENIYFFATEDNLSTTAPRTVEITVSGTRSGSKKFNVKLEKRPTGDGWIPNSVLIANGWPVNRLPKIGLQLAVRGNRQPGKAAAADDPIMPIVKEYQHGWTGFGPGPKLGDGKTNYAFFAVDLDMYVIGNACKNLGPEWYVPSKDELILIYNNRFLLGTSYSFLPELYWSASECTNIRFWAQNFASNGVISGEYEMDPRRVRCMKEF